MILNSLVVGRLIQKVPTIIAEIDSKHPVNKSVSTITFKAHEPVKGLKSFHSDIQMIGRHYLVRDINHKNVKRHYTISNCMQKDVYKEYVRILNEGSARTSLNKDTENYFDDRDQDQLIMTIKNYNLPKGLSHNIHTSEKAQFEIKGPMGKGLDIQSKGTHIAFTAGTGCLVFVDLVAHLIRKNNDLLREKEEAFIDKKDFKFVFFVSFPTREEGIALELCEGLLQNC